MNPGVGVAGVHLDEPSGQPPALLWREPLLAELPQDQDQGSTNRDVILRIQLPLHLFPVRFERAHAVNEIAARPRVGPMLEQRPDLVLALEPQQSHGGIGLAFRQTVLGRLGDQWPVPGRCAQHSFTPRSLSSHFLDRPLEVAPRDPYRTEAVGR